MNETTAKLVKLKKDIMFYINDLQKEKKKLLRTNKKLLVQGNKWKYDQNCVIIMTYDICVVKANKRLLNGKNKEEKEK